MPFKSDKQRRFLWSQKPEVAKQIAYKQTGGEVPMTDGRKPKKVTQKDRYGNQVSYEFESDTKPLDLNSLLEKFMDNPPQSIGIPQEIPGVGGVSIGFADSHPGEPRGSDTVPAWLTPGEFVVNKEAMDDPANAAAVKAINDEGRAVQQMKHGGAAYLQGGGDPALAALRQHYEWLYSKTGVEAFNPARLDHGVDWNEDKTDHTKGAFSGKIRSAPAEDKTDVAKPVVKSPLAAAAPKPKRKQGSRYSVDVNDIPLGSLFGVDLSASGGYESRIGKEDPWRAGIKGSFKFNEGGPVDERGFWDRLKLLAGLEDTPAVPDLPAPATVAPEEPIPTSRPMSPEQALIQAREGYSDEVYEDTRGFNTVGFGHRTDEPVGSVPYTREQNEGNLDTNIETAKTAAQTYAGDKWNDLNKQQKAALTSMALQLGATGQAGFEDMQAALRAGDWAGVRREARDSLWARQTPARVEDIEAAFRATGGPIHPEHAADMKMHANHLIPPIYAQAGLPVGAQGSGRTVMYNPETGEYEFADEQMLPDILAGQEEGAAAAAAQSQALTDQFAAEDEQANMDYEGVTDFSSGPMTVPGTETPPPVPNKATENMGLVGKAIDYFGGPSDAANIGAEEREAQQNRGRTADKEAALAQAETELTDLEESAASAIEAGDYQAYGQLRAEAARKQSEIDHRKDEVLSAQAEQANDITDHKARRVARQNEIVSERLTALAEAHTAAIDAGDTEAVAAIEQEIDEVAASKDTDPHGDEAAAKELKDNKPGPEDDKATLEQLAESEEFEDEDAPDKDSDKGTQSPSEVEAAGKEAAAADPSVVDKAKGFFKDAFSDLFDGKELARMALMYAGSRALGYSHGGSLNWAAKQYVSRLDSKQDSINELVKSGKYTPASIQQYKETGDISVLRAPGTPANPLGNFKVFYDKNGKKVRAQEFKVGDAKVWQTADGRAVDSSYSEDPSVVRGTPEYGARVKEDSKQYTGMINDLRTQFGTVKTDKGDIFKTELAPSVAGNKVAKWALNNNVPPEYMGGIIENAYHSAIQHSEATGEKVRDLTPFLEEQYIAAQVGDTSLFKTEEGKPVDGVAVNKMFSAVKAAAGPAGQNLTTDQILTGYQSAWNKLDPEVQKQWNRKATATENGFMKFVMNDVNKNL